MVHHRAPKVLGPGDTVGPSPGPPTASRPPVILQFGPRDFSVLVRLRDEDETPVDRVVKEKIKPASTAGVLARKLSQARA